MTKCILVIDDEPDIRDIAKISLEITRQWTVLVASSGQDGVAIAKDKQPDAILLDAKMPGMDGLTTLKTLHQEQATQAIPVVMLTATNQAELQRQFASAGAKAVVIKPFDPGLLAEQIETALSWSV